MRWMMLAMAAPLLVGACDVVLPGRGAPRADSTAAVEPASKPVRAAAAHRRKAAAGSTVDQGAAFTTIRDALRRLVVAEETYFAENGTYTGDLDGAGFRPPADVTVTILWATRDGWAARARHGGMPGKDCVVYVGSRRSAPASAKHGRQAREGMPACDMAEPRPAAPAHASTPAPTPASTAPAPPDTGSGLDAVGPIVQMKVDLWNLVRSQQAWYATQGAYAWRTEPFAMQYLWNRGVQLRILSAGRDAWSAKATHEALPGKSCVIWFGPVADWPRTDGQGREAARAAVPVCDDPS
jgi:hypothetical protein